MSDINEDAALDYLTDTVDNIRKSNEKRKKNIRKMSLDLLFDAYTQDEIKNILASIPVSQRGNNRYITSLLKVPERFSGSRTPSGARSPRELKWLDLLARADNEGWIDFTTISDMYTLRGGGSPMDTAKANVRALRRSVQQRREDREQRATTKAQTRKLTGSMGNPRVSKISGSMAWVSTGAYRTWVDEPEAPLRDMRVDVSLSPAGDARMLSSGGVPPNKTVRAEELLSNPDVAKEIQKRNAEVEALSVQERYKRYADPNNPDVQYVLHWGASELSGGELDPARSRGTNTGSTIGNTRAINIATAQPFVAETIKMRKEQEEVKKLLDDIYKGEIINVGPKGRNENWNSVARNTLEAYGFGGGFISDDGEIRWGRISEVIGEERLTEWYHGQVAKIQKITDEKETRIANREKVSAQLVSDEYQYSSSLYAAQMKPAWGYLGRYQDEGADEASGASWGDNAKGSETGAIHIFRVTPENSTTMGSDEVHLVGKHKPVASLVVPTGNDGEAG